MSEIETQEDNGPEVFHIANKAQAAWAMEKLADVTRRQEENKAVARERIESITEWLKQENDKLQGDVDFFGGKLIEWHMSLIEADPEDEAAWKKQKDKTVTLPDGVLKVNVGRYSTIIEDGIALMSWAQESEHEDWVDIVLASDIKKKVAATIEDTGESIPGVKYERGETTFTVKPKVGE